MSRLGNLLERFGSPLHAYSGTGLVHFRSGEQSDVEFAVAQFPDGTNVVLCEHLGTHRAQLLGELFTVDAALRLEGETREGWKIETEGKLWSKDFPGDIPREWGAGSWSSYGAQRIQVHARSGTPANIHYGLANVRPPGVPRLALRLGIDDDTHVEVQLVRVPDYRFTFDRVRVLRGVAVTCELVIPIQDGAGVDLQQVAENVCYLLSIAQGCKVEWVYREEHDQRGLLSREHCMRKTKPYCTLSAIDLRTLTGPKEFVETTYSTYVGRRDSWGLDAGPIDTYLEAKAETDFLETRAAKLAVALEALKHRYLQSADASISEFVLDSERFEKLLPELVTATSAVFRDHDAWADQWEHLSGKLQVLNRESFSRILRKLADDIGLRLTSRDRRRFIDSRNALVHQGQFYCQALAKAEIERRSKPADSLADEYFFMLNVLDRVFLTLVGYAGEYVDWRKPNGPEVTRLP